MDDKEVIDNFIIPQAKEFCMIVFYRIHRVALSTPPSALMNALREHGLAFCDYLNLLNRYLTSRRQVVGLGTHLLVPFVATLREVVYEVGMANNFRNNSHTIAFYLVLARYKDQSLIAKWRPTDAIKCITVSETLRKTFGTRESAIFPSNVKLSTIDA
ncbi:hypothetical protein RF11_02872 [Thelohanellus kitauei]|uniref:Uncharacterized protein n=1 Tax=Thelohanellus kitauei TaxID=669202 RepID=A0A0C2J205_THEKT|nr:hypothetical protein RF11_02872 [Thelohanellus kitauei]